jgi:ATP-binding cassette subfamily B protein
MIPLLSGDAVDLLLGKGQVQIDEILLILMKIAAATLLCTITQYLINLSNNHITYHVIFDLRQDTFHKLQQLPISYLDKHQTGDLLSRMVSDVESFADGLLMGFSQFFTGLVTIFGTIFFMMNSNIPIALVVICLTPLSIVVARFITKKTYAMFRKQSTIRGEQTAFSEEMLKNLKEVKAFSWEQESIAHFDEINKRFGVAALKATFFSSLTNPATRFVNGICYGVVGMLGAYVAINGGISIGRLTSFLSYANQYTKPFNEISGVMSEMQNAIACAERIFEILDAPSQSLDAADTLESNNIQGAVSLSHVSFRYVPTKPLIEDFCLEVRPGERVAIVGPTGCGKTTLINLLMRFYDADRGEILIDIQNIQSVTRESLRRCYGMVLQETWLRSCTVYENLSMGKPGASPEEIVEAAKAVHAHSFIKRLPQGYDTILTEDGGNLSQGQKQLLCIARVMLSLPPMLILDEATSSIDTRTEQQIQSAFAKMMKGRTSFIVAHRLSTIKEADVILVMRDGNVVEQGNHTSLLEKQGFYATLYQSQFAPSS